MGFNRSDDRGERRSFGGGFGRDRGFGGGRGGFGGGRGFRERPQMHEATCDKCKQQCEVPFRPTGDKPVFCSECFKTEGGATSASNSRSFEPRGNSGSGITSEQFNQLNAKLDKIIEFLGQLEVEDDLDEAEEDTEEKID